MRGKSKFHLLGKIGIGFLVGIVLGLVFGPSITVIKPLGDLFIRLLKMLVLPLIFFSLVNGVASMKDIGKMLRVGIKSIFYFAVTTAFAIAIGLFFANFFEPGVGTALQIPAAQIKQAATPSIVATFLDMVPTNIFSALTNERVLQVVVFAMFFGVCIVLLGDRVKAIRDGFGQLAEIMFRMTEMVIAYAPIGVCALIASVVGTHGAQVLIPLGKLLLVFHAAIIVHMIVVQGAFVGLISGVNPIVFLRKMLPAMAFAYATDSSNATLPLTMKCTTEGLGVSEGIASFVLPIGATVNMNGSALYQGMVAVFVAQISGVDLSVSQQLTILLTALLAAVGTAGVPGASLIMLTMTLTSVGLPLEGIAIVASVDRILGGARCVPNIVGDAATALIVAKQEGEFDRRIYNSKEGE
ncbi:dicarboxylate/amino acid:cation symporter [Pyramidobacter sp.]|uniref:dicarboxylate/amino acid:cation symporter n=1 Tax=Pyramidobacter sp. TaxID=1943581 RepID=UPI0025DC1E92|nr:dicarboxylate/amino acid:cation symporter [Pyramidobacter sp.]MCI7403148.1 dicarboxylate/amino acid:cation symporter [Pyramidobacter sp.]MDY3212138.1 dicarboxylate/amino acid:cation symporter [Pyramidobacter sp.]